MKYTFVISILLFALLSGNHIALAMKPVKEYSIVPDTLRLPYEKNILTTSDGLHLKSWTFLPAKGLDKKTTLVLAYADAGNMSWWLSQATILSQSGYTVLLFDYRGFGQSDPFDIDGKMLYYNEFTADLAAAVEFARKKYSANKTGIWCFSMGTIITTFSATTIHPDFIIGDGFITSPIAVQQFYAKKNDFIKLPPRAADYDAALAAIKAPMLLFAGSDDKVSTPASIKALKQKKTTLTVISYKGGHLAGFNVLSKTFPGSEYVKAVDKFLKAK